MACVESMEKLSLLESVQPPLNDTSSPLMVDTPKVFAAKVDGIHTDFVINDLRDRVFVIVTQCKKLASFISVSKDTLKNVQDNFEDIYTVKTVFGIDSETSQHLVARFLAEQTGIQKPALFALGLKDYSPRTVRALSHIINEHKSW